MANITDPFATAQTQTSPESSAIVNPFTQQTQATKPTASGIVDPFAPKEPSKTTETGPSVKDMFYKAEAKAITGAEKMKQEYLTSTSEVMDLALGFPSFVAKAVETYGAIPGVAAAKSKLGEEHGLLQSIKGATQQVNEEYAMHPSWQVGLAPTHAAMVAAGMIKPEESGAVGHVFGALGDWVSGKENAIEKTTGKEGTKEAVDLAVNTIMSVIPDLLKAAKGQYARVSAKYIAMKKVQAAKAAGASDSEITDEILRRAAEQGIDTSGIDPASMRDEVKNVPEERRNLPWNDAKKQEYQLAAKVIKAANKILAASDPNTVIHEGRVASSTARLVKELGLSEEQQVRADLAASGHDLGKMGMRSLLEKQTPLTDSERTVIGNHPMETASVMKALGIPDNIIQTASEHHFGATHEFTSQVVRTADIGDSLIGGPNSGHDYPLKFEGKEYPRTAKNVLMIMDDMADKGTLHPEIYTAFRKLFVNGDLPAAQKIQLKAAGEVPWEQLPESAGIPSLSRMIMEEPTAQPEVHQMDVEKLWSVKDKDRRLEPKTTTDAPEGIEDVKKSLMKSGIKKPVTLTVSTADGMAYLTDGNTRISAAHELGMEKAPVKIEKTDVPFTEWQKAKALPLDQLGITKDMIPEKVRSPAEQADYEELKKLLASSEGSTHTREFNRFMISDLPAGMQKAAEMMIENAREGKPGGLVVGNFESNLKHIADRYAKKHGSSPQAVLDEMTRQVSKGGLSKRVQGSYNPDLQTLYLHMDNISPENVAAVFMHEIYHAAEDPKLDAAVLDTLNAEKEINPDITYDDLKSPNIYRRVLARRELAGPMAKPAYETTSYLIEESFKMGKQEGFSKLDQGFWKWAQSKLPEPVNNFLRQFVANIRAALYRYGISIGPEDLTVEDILALIKQNAKDIAAGKREPAGLDYFKNKTPVSTAVEPSVKEEPNSIDQKNVNYFKKQLGAADKRLIIGSGLALGGMALGAYLMPNQKSEGLIAGAALGIGAAMLPEAIRAIGDNWKSAIKTAAIGGAYAGVGALVDQENPVEGILVGSAIFGLRFLPKAPIHSEDDLINARNGNIAAERRLIKQVTDAMRRVVPDAKQREELAVLAEDPNFTGRTPQEKAVVSAWRGFARSYYELAKDEGIKLGFIEGYVSHIIEREGLPQTEVQQVMKQLFDIGPKQVGGKARFVKERQYMTFEELEKALEGTNLKLKTKDIADIAQIYGETMNRTIENQRLLNNLKEMKYKDGTEAKVLTLKPTTGYETINHPQFYATRKIPEKTETGETVVHVIRTPYYVHPDIAPALKFVFDAKDHSAVGTGLIALNRAVKRMNVVGSFFHAKSLLEAYALSGGRLFGVKATINSALDQFKTGGLGDEIDKGMRSGLRVDMPMEVSEQAMAQAGNLADMYVNKMLGTDIHPAGKVFGKLEDIQHKTFDKVTWEYLHTGLKLATYLRLMEDFKLGKKGKGMSEDQYRQGVASHVNDTFGGLDWFRVVSEAKTSAGRQFALGVLKPSSRDWLGVAVFAPDWTASTLRAMTKALPGGVKNPANAMLARQYALRTAVFYATAITAANYALSGHFPWDNKDPTRLDLGDGTTMQVAKHSMEAAQWVTEPWKTFSNKMGFIPRTMTALTYGQEYPGGPKIKNKLGYVTEELSPFTARSFQGEIDPEMGFKRSLLSMFGSPVYGMTDAEKEQARARRKQQQDEYGQ